MSIVQSLIEEIQRERGSTKQHLTRIPADKFDWKPHEKSMSIKALSAHIAEIAGLPGLIIKTDEVDLADGNKKPEIKTADDLVKFFEENTDQTIGALQSAKDEDLKKVWKMRHGDHVIMEMPKGDALRMMGMSHLYHHRGQLGVYLRILDIPVPSTYGPSADES